MLNLSTSLLKKGELEERKLNWRIVAKGSFKRAFKKLEEGDKGRVLEAIKELTESEVPERMGQLLGGRYEKERIRKYRVGKIRILYRVDREGGRIELLDLGLRREIYRK